MLSICIITKNEEQNIKRCLSCLSDTELEIIVVDTGSIDRTKEIAREYTDFVYDFAWKDDFAAAKNYAISKASNEYVMVIDSDEFLEKTDLVQLEELIEAHPDDVGRIRRINVFSRDGVGQENREWLNRIFSKKKFHYEGRIHEQVVPYKGDTYDTYQTPVTILHTGYDLPMEERRKKAERNALLLQKELENWEEKYPGITYEAEKYQISSRQAEQISYILYQLGKSAYMAQDYEKACDYFARGLSFDLNPRLEYVIDMVETYGYALLNSNRAEEALFFEGIRDEFGDSADFQFLMGLIYMNNGRFEEAVAQFEKATEQKDCKMTGVNSYLAYYNIGVIYECLGQKDKALAYYGKCPEYGPVKKRMQEMDDSDS